MSAQRTGFGSKLLIYIIAAMLVGLKLSSLYCKKVEPNHHPAKEVWVNVFVHGIMSIKPHLSWSNFMLFLKDEVEGTLYEKTVELMREDAFFFRNQAMQKIGLRQIDPLLFEGNASASLAFVLDEIGKHYGLERTNLYYTYGWSGLLSAKSRYNDAKKLFIALENEVNRLRSQHMNPKIRLIGYSHGGNVNLNLAAVRQKEFQQSPLIIDEVVNIGVPVITDSDYLITDQLFKRIFHLYSPYDRVQALDVFAPNQIFSSRIFRPRKGFELPKKLIQIQLKVTRCKNNIIDSPQRFSRSTDLSRRHIIYGKKGPLRDVSPGHVELWFFGWTPLYYRDHYPLYPLPTISFAPVILHHAEKIAQSMSPEHSVIADIRPQHNVIIFRKYQTNQIHSTVPYMPEHKLKTLQDVILQCKPHLYSDDIYRAHIQDAVRNAQQIMDKNNIGKIGI